MEQRSLHYELETVPCALCGSARHAIYLRQARELFNGLDACFDVVRCSDCGFIFTNPRPTAATIACFYPDSATYYQPKQEREKSLRPGFRGRLQRARLARHRGYPFREGGGASLLAALGGGRDLLLAHVPRHVAGGRLLDIGCAWGGYLSRMRDLGWQVQGLELNARAAEHARRELGLAVRTGSFAEIDEPPGSYQVVHLSMVLEHLYDPAGALAKIHSLLTEGGELILSVPDISGWEARLFKAHAYTLQVPQHLSHFSPATVTDFLHRAGFRVDRIVHQNSRKDLVKSADYLESRLPRRLLRNPLVKTLLGPVCELIARAGKSSRMSVFAVKADGRGER